MAVDYSIPNWIRPADPAQHYAQGLQIGARIGAEQAAQQFQQQQLYREQQRDEFERQLASQKQQIAIDQITRKQRAGAQYQMLVQGGMDPMQALQQVGPDLADPTELIEMKQRADQLTQAQKYRQDQMTLANQKLAEETRYHTGELKAREAAVAKPNVKESERAKGLQLIQRERELQALVSSQPDNPEWKEMLQKTQDEKGIWEAQQGLTESTEITMGPTGLPTVKISKGGRSTLPAGMTTTAEATKEAEQKNLGQDVLRTLGRLQDDLQPGVVGLGANVANFIFDKFLPALGVQSASQERILGRQDIRLANQSLMGALSKRFSTTELSKIKEMLPSLGFIESPRDAKLLVSAIQRQIAEENAASARKLKQEPDQQTIETLANLHGVTWESLAQDVKDGRLDRATYEAVVNYANSTKGKNARPANQP